MTIKIQDIEFPKKFVRNILLEDKKIIISMPEFRNLEFTFEDKKSAEAEYNKIINELKLR